VTVTPRSRPMLLIPNPTYAPVVVTSAKIVHGRTTVLVSLPPPGWVERHRSAVKRNVPEERSSSEERVERHLLATGRSASEERDDSEECGSFSPDLGDGPPEHPHPPAPAKSKPKARIPFRLGPNWTNGGRVFQEYTFSKRKIYNTQFTKYWIVRYGELLPSPPPEADASKCSGPTVFINVPPDGERQIWLWSADRRVWDTVSIKHNVDLDVRRELKLNSKHVPVFVLPRANRRGGEEDSPRFIRYITPSS